MKVQEIQDPCRHLRARAPQEWDAFVLMFHQFTAEHVDAVSEADAGEIMTQKGRALACKALLNAFITLDRQPPAHSAPAPIPAAAAP